MTCYQSTTLPGGVTTTGRASYTTEAECNQACKEGACCEGTSCTVKPQCQCQGTGKVFKGVGTTCASLNGACCEDGPAGTPPTCSIKNECECVGHGKTFRGVGSTCASGVCCKSCAFSTCASPLCMPRYIVASFSATTQEYVSYIFNETCRVPALTVGGSLTLSGVFNTSYPCGTYSAVYEGANASPFNGSRVAVVASPGAGGSGGGVVIRKKVTFGSVTGGVRSLSLSNDWPIVHPTPFLDFTFRFDHGSVTTAGGIFQNPNSGYCYGGGTSALMWVQFDQTSGEFQTTAGSISASSSYGGDFSGV